MKNIDNFFEAEGSEQYISFELRNITNLALREIGKNHPHHPHMEEKVTKLQGWVIYYLIKNQERDVFQREFEENFSMRRSTVSRLLQTMEQNQLIIRKSVGQDARLKKIILTDKAIQMHNDIVEFATTLEKKMRQGIKNEDLQIFFKVIDQIKSNLKGEYNKC